MAAPRAFRFGVSSWGASSRAEWRDKARRAEDAGFDVLLIADHFVDGMLPPFAAMTAAAEATEHIRVGTLVLNNDFRHPAVVAREAAAVDLLTEGRLPLLPMLDVDDILASPYGLFGTEDEIADQLRERRDRLGVSYITVFEKDLDAAARIMTRLRPPKEP